MIKAKRYGIKMKRKDEIKKNRETNKEELIAGTFMVAILGCCIALPVLLLGGIGIVSGFLSNNLIIIVAGIIAIGFGAYVYLSKKRTK